MSVTFLGEVTCAGVIGPFGLALSGFETSFNAAVAAVRASLNLLVSVKGSIRASAVADLEAQLNASIAAQASINASLVDPAAYLNGLLAAINALISQISSLRPELALSAQLSASASFQASVTAKIAAFDLALSGLLSVSAQISAALNLPFPALPTAGGVFCFEYDGPLASLGSALDAAVGPASGIGGGTNVRATVVVVTQANGLAVDGLKTILISAP